MHRTLKLLLIACFSLQIMLSGCGFHLRNQNTLPSALQQIEVVSNRPYSPFIKQLKRELALLKTQSNGQHNTSQLIIHKHHLSYRMPIIGGSQQARIYRYTFILEYSLMYQGKPLIRHKSIMASKMLTLNQDALLTTNNQLDLLTVDIQETAIAQLINELKAFSSISSYNQSQPPLEDVAPNEDSESPLLPYQDGSNI